MITCHNPTAKNVQVVRGLLVGAVIISLITSHMFLIKVQFLFYEKCSLYIIKEKD